MRIVWVKVGGLWPLNTGGRLRSFHILSELSRRHDVTLLTTHRPGEDHGELLARLEGRVRVLSFPHTPPKQGGSGFALALARSWLSRLPVDLSKWRVPALRRELERMAAAGEAELCVADFLSSVPNVPLDGPLPVVFFEHNVEYVIWRRLRDVEKRRSRRLLLELEWRKTRRQEARACAQAGLVVAVSEADRDALQRLAPSARVVAVPTGVDTSYFAPNGVPEAKDALAFTGSMDWYPNEDAILHFLDAILPRVRRQVPAASLTVVGRNPSERLRQAAAAVPGVTVTGIVDDVRPHVAQAAVYVVPLRVGGGTRLKIFEALSMAKPVVSTAVGAEGLPLRPGEHFVQADDPEAFAAEIVGLLRDPDRRRALGAAGRRLVEERYTWPQVARVFEDGCRSVMP